MIQPVQPLDEYFAALERLKAGKPRIVLKGSRITNDAVSLEAGRGKGSIKKSRGVFADLIAEIDRAAAAQAKPENDQRNRLAKARAEADDYRRQLEAALGRELSLVKELYETRKRLAALTGDKVLPLHGRTNLKKEPVDG